MWHHLLKVKEMGFSGINNFPTHCIIDGQFRAALEETGMGFYKEVEMVSLANKMDLFSIVYVATPEEARQMAEAGADAIIAHVGVTVGGSIGVVDVTCTMDEAAERTQAIIDAAKTVNPGLFFLTHGGPVNTPDDVRTILRMTTAHGFVGASSLERMGVEKSLTELTEQFKSIVLP
jgi:predicted TIM-barrel enzyme